LANGDPREDHGVPDHTLEHVENLDEIYQLRFTSEDAKAKEAMWGEICRYLQRFVPLSGAVLDIAADRGHFIRHIQAREKWATDLRSVQEHLGKDVRFVLADGLKLTDHLPNAYFDVAFMSNYLEHLPSSEAVVDQLRVARDLVKPGGAVLVLQPNIRFVGGSYWDFIDHQTALTDRSLEEAGEIAGLRTRLLIRRFLPYTTKSRMPQHPLLVRAYLNFPPAWRLLGKQTLYLGERPL
jgi:SAM-dependent methyltransferase